MLPTLAKVRGILAATFNRLVKAVALAADGEEGDASVAGRWTSRPPAGEEATVVERDGEVEFGATGRERGLCLLAGGGGGRWELKRGLRMGYDKLDHERAVVSICPLHGPSSRVASCVIGVDEEAAQNISAGSEPPPVTLLCLLLSSGCVFLTSLPRNRSQPCFFLSTIELCATAHRATPCSRRAASQATSWSSSRGLGAECGDRSDASAVPVGGRRLDRFLEVRNLHFFSDAALPLLVCL